MSRPASDLRKNQIGIVVIALIGVLRCREHRSVLHCWEV